MCNKIVRIWYEKKMKHAIRLCDKGLGKDMQGLLGLQGDQTSQSWRKSVLNIHWKDGCWSWSSNTLATWCEELTHWKRPWCWERLKTEAGDDRGWHGWMASLTQWTWVWASSTCSVLQSRGSQRVRHDWATEQQKTEKNKNNTIALLFSISNILVIKEKKKKHFFFFFLETYRRETSPWSKKQMPAFHFFPPQLHEWSLKF